MIKKLITYTDFDGNEQTEEAYFHLSKAELLDMEVSVSGGLSEKLKAIVEENDVKEIVRILKEIILSSYGKKSEDGRRFLKSEEETQLFSETEAYSELFSSLALDAEAAAAFINGVLPNMPQDHQPPAEPESEIKHLVSRGKTKSKKEAPMKALPYKEEAD